MERWQSGLMRRSRKPLGLIEVPGVRIPPSPYSGPQENHEAAPVEVRGIPNPRGREHQRDSPFGLSSSERSEPSRTARRGQQLAKQDARIPPLRFRKPRTARLTRPGLASFGRVRWQVGGKLAKHPRHAGLRGEHRLWRCAGV